MRDIKPIFEKSCLACHGGDKPKGALDLGTVANLIKGGQSGQPAIIPGQPDASPLLRFVQDRIKDLEMPPLGRRARYPALTKAEVGMLRDRIQHQGDLPAKP
ncbi:MAG TPA: hypothetical protein P5534_13590 [Candidatus Paceibacterota bacterium]|nr:hypothetical protein [Candidatus Paceibacterota bacterium]